MDRERERDVINKVINAVAFKHNHNVHLHSAQGVKSLIYNGMDTHSFSNISSRFLSVLKLLV